MAARGSMTNSGSFSGTWSQTLPAMASPIMPMTVSMTKLSSSNEATSGKASPSACAWHFLIVAPAVSPR